MIFIVFEGLDGSGKSSLMLQVEKHLAAKGKAFHRTREPGGTALGDEIRNLILRKDGQAPTARTELLLYEASRAQHVDMVIAPMLKKNVWVLCDRFTASSVAFQAGGREISVQDVETLNAFATGGLKPHLTVLLDLPVTEARQRQGRRAQETGESKDRIESEADTFHERVRHSFLNQAKSDLTSWLVLDAAQSTEQMAESVLAKLQANNWL